MKCWACTSENWFIFDKGFVSWDRQLGICKECGAVAFQVSIEEESKVKDYYTKEYRGNIGPTNLTTTSRKLNYFKDFIESWLIPVEQSGKKLITGDVGCATGYIVDWFRRRGHKATGSEWTLSMRRFAEHFYGLPITQELTDKHKYDLITMYHTFEHMIEPDKKLERYLSYLADGGHLLISVPEWLNTIEQSGSSAVESFDQVFHKDHINVFSKQSIQNVFSKFDLIIVKQDFLTYGQTYLLRKKLPTEVGIPFVKEDWQKIKDIIERQKKAIELYIQAMSGQKDRLFREAINIYPLFPDAYYNWLINSTQKKDRERVKELIDEAFKIMPGNVKITIISAYYNYQEQLWEQALKDFDYLIKYKVTEDFLIYRGHCLTHLGRLKEAMNSFHDAATLNPQKWAECMMYLCRNATQLDCWEEVAIKNIKEKLFKEADVKIAPVDPVFENKEAIPSAN